MRGSEQVQVQLHLPLTSQPREQPCSSSTAHESLRRFAQGYVFGATSRIGAPENLQSQQSVNTSPPAFPRNDHTDFASRVVKKEDDIRENTTRRRKRPDGRRSALVFGENAPKVTLPVKGRIVRKTAPKSSRDSINVDALTAMMEGLLSDQSCQIRKKARIDDDENLAKTLGDMKLRRKPSERICKTKNSKAIKSAKPDAKSDGVGLKRDAKRMADQIAKLEDDDASDELCFLVNRCDLNSDKKQATFMPYIT